MFTIRNSTTLDIPLIRELTFKVWPQTYAAILSKEQIDYMLEWMYSESSLLQQMKDGSRFIMGYDKEEPIGFAAYQEIAPACFKLHKLYVLPSQQGKGTGKLIIDHILQSMRETGGAALQLQVNRNNKAVGFYKKLGFTVIEEADFEIGNGYFMKDFVMEKKI